MADVFTLNKSIATGDEFKAQYYMTYSMLKAGWLLKASSDGSGGAKSLSADPNDCRWGAPVAVSGQTGATASIGAKTGKDYLITGLVGSGGGLLTPSKTNGGGSEGNILYFTGAASNGNNTAWLISQVVSSTSCYARPLVPKAVVHTAGAGPAMTLSGHRCKTVRNNVSVRCSTTGTVVSGTAQVQVSLDGGSNWAAAVTVPTTGIVELIDENGVHTGIYATFASGTLTSSSDIWDSLPSAASDAANGAIGWTEKSWLLTAYTTGMANGAWILLEGPMTLKVPFLVAPGTTFFRGENVVQSGTGAEGELLGITWDPLSGAGVGYAVVMPRLQGSGAGPEGWSSSGVITGSRSGATVTPNAVPVRFCREVMWMRGPNKYDGTTYYQPGVDDASEAAQRFARLAQESGCTATVCPGGGGTNNGFPAVAYVGGGTGGSISHQSSSTWRQSTWLQTSNPTIGNAQIFCANCIERQNVSHDGSFMGLMGQPGLTSSSASCMQAFHRCDNCEEGDIEPYVGGTQGNTGVPGTRHNNRTSNTASAAGGNSNDSVKPRTFVAVGQDNYFGGFGGWRRRGLSGESFVELTGCYLVGYGISVHGMSTLSSDPEKVASTAMASAPLVLDPVYLMTISQLSGQKMRKGSLRWLYIGDSNGTAFDTWGGKTWMQPNVSGISDIGTCALFFPWDGSSVPVQ